MDKILYGELWLYCGLSILKRGSCSAWSDGWRRGSGWSLRALRLWRFYEYIQSVVITYRICELYLFLVDEDGYLRMC